MMLRRQDIGHQLLAVPIWSPITDQQPMTIHHRSSVNICQLLLKMLLSENDE